jgi:hypothetical protein
LKRLGLLSALLLVMSLSVFAQLAQSSSSSISDRRELRLTLIAQGGRGEWNRMMDEKCREWENSKNAPASAAWTCLNGRAATQQETNDAITRLHQQGERNTQKWLDQQKQQQQEGQKLINKYSGGTRTQNRNGMIEIPRTTVPHLNPQPAQVLALPATWSFAHPGADMLMAIDVAALQQSSVLQQMLTRLPEAVQVNARNFAGQLKQLGDVEKAWLSIRSGDFLALLQGRLNFPPGFVQLANGMASYRISKTAVVLGRSAAVSQAEERLSHTSAATSLISRRMTTLSTGNAISMTATRALLKSQAMVPASQSKDISGFSFAMGVRDGLNLDLRMNSDTVAGARRLFETMQKNATAADSPVKASSKLEGTSMRITAAIPREELLLSFDKALASAMGQRLMAMASAPTNKVVVQGLPGGAKEVQTSGELMPSSRDGNEGFGKVVVQGMPGGTKVIESPH